MSAGEQLDLFGAPPAPPPTDGRRKRRTATDVVATGADTSRSDPHAGDSRRTSRPATSTTGSGGAATSAAATAVAGTDRVDPDDVHGTDAHGVDAHGTDAHGTDAHGTDAHGTDAHGTDPNGTDAHGADPNGAGPNGADPNGADPNGADANGTDVNDVDASDAVERIAGVATDAADPRLAAEGDVASLGVLTDRSAERTDDAGGEGTADAAPVDLRRAVLEAVREWAERGWLRRLDAALARFVADGAPSAAAPVLLATALVAHLEGQGHTCLVLDDLLRDPARALRWGGDAEVALRRVLAWMPPGAAGWIDALSAAAVVHVDRFAAAPGGRPTARTVVDSPATGGPGKNISSFIETTRGDAGRRDQAPAGLTAASGTVWSDDGGREPLVLSSGRVYLRRYWRHERRVAAAVRLRAATFDTVDAAAVRPWLDRLFPPAPAAGAAPDGARESGTDRDIDWQKVACALALRGRLALVTGGPGTGKTYTAARLLVLLYATAPDPDRLRIALAAPTGKAAARLRQSIDTALGVLERQLGADGAAINALASRLAPARTLHALLGTRPGTRRFRHDAAHPLDVDVVVVDEASMIHVEMMDALLSALPPTARVLLLGDRDQLASVEAGAVLGELCRDADLGRYHRGTVRAVAAVTGESIPAAMVDDDGPALSQHIVMLRRSQRFDGDIAALAQAVNAGDAVAAASLLSARADGAVAWTVAPSPAVAVDVAVSGRNGFAGGYERYLMLVQRGPEGPSDDDATAWVRAVLDAFDTVRVLCAVREGDWGVAGINRAIVERLAARGLVPARGEWYPGRPVIVTRNDPALGVFNGDIGIALRLPAANTRRSAATATAADRPAGDAGLRVCFADGAGIRSIGVGRLGAVDTAFALTVHKSQGSEFDHTVLVLPPDTNPVTTRELAYTGITRARSAFTLVSSRHEALAETLAQTTQRASGLIGFLAGAGPVLP